MTRAGLAYIVQAEPYYGETHYGETRYGETHGGKSKLGPASQSANSAGLGLNA